MGWLRGNLHAHTTYSDGVKTPQELLVEYEALGYDFLAITDHGDLIGPSSWRALPRLRPRLLLFHGVELNYTGFEQHIGRVLGDREVLHVLSHAARYKRSVAQTIERARTIQRDGLVLDAWEVTDTGHHRPLYASPEIPLVKIATDDAHRPVHFGRAWIEVDATPERDAIIRAIRAGDFRLGFAPDAEERGYVHERRRALARRHGAWDADDTNRPQPRSRRRIHVLRAHDGEGTDPGRRDRARARGHRVAEPPRADCRARGDRGLLCDVSPRRRPVPDDGSGRLDGEGLRPDPRGA